MWFSYTYTCIYHFSNSFPIKSLQNIEQSSLYNTVSPCWLSSVKMWPCHSQIPKLSVPPLPTQDARPHSELSVKTLEGFLDWLFYYRTVLDLQKNCKDSAENPPTHQAHTQSSSVTDIVHYMIQLSQLTNQCRGMTMTWTPYFIAVPPVFTRCPFSGPGSHLSSHVTFGYHVRLGFSWLWLFLWRSLSLFFMTVTALRSTSWVFCIMSINRGSLDVHLMNRRVAGGAGGPQRPSASVVTSYEGLLLLFNLSVLPCSLRPHGL